MANTRKALIGIAVLAATFFLGAFALRTDAQEPKKDGPYKAIRVRIQSGAGDVERLETALNDMTRKGWSYEGSIDGGFLIFKKGR